jgi:predicted site-specific integrase-resolvase
MKRKGFLKLLRMILNNEVPKIVTAYPDRLLRFGLEIIEEACKAHNCEIVVLNKEDKTPEQELIEDLTSILVSFSGKLYGMSHKYEKVKKCVEELKA